MKQKNSLTLKQRISNSCLYHRLNRDLEERGEQLDRLLEERGELTKRLEDLEARDREQIKVRLCWEDWCRGNSWTCWKRGGSSPRGWRTWSPGIGNRLR